jgi:O-antigen ligase
LSGLSLLLSVFVLVTLSASALFRPINAVALWVFMFPLEQALQSQTTFFHSNQTALNMICGSVVCIAMLRKQVSAEGRISQVLNPAFGTLALLLVFAGISMNWSAYKSNASEQIWWNFPYIVVSIVCVPLCVASLQDIGQLRKLVMLFGCVLAAAIFADQNFTFFAERARLELGAGQRGNPLAVAEVGGLMMIFAALGPGGDIRKVALLVRGITIVLGAGLCLTSGSRGQLVAAVLVSFILFPFTRPMGNVRSVISLLATILLVGGLLYLSTVLFLSSENLSRWSTDSLSGGAGDRLDFVRNYFDVWLRDPSVWVFGLGTMSFGAIVSSGNFVENLNVEILIEEGLVGLVLYLAVLVCVGRSIVYLWLNSTKSNEDRADIVTLIGVIFYFFVVASKSFNVWTAHPYWMWLMVAASISAAQQRRQRDLH